MKNLLKFAFTVLAILFSVSLFSCGKEDEAIVEGGGIIFVKNNYSEDKTVTVYSDFSIEHMTSLYATIKYKDRYGPQSIPADSTVAFIVNSDAHYGIVWRHDGKDSYTTVNASNNEAVDVRIP